MIAIENIFFFTRRLPNTWTDRTSITFCITDVKWNLQFSTKTTRVCSAARVAARDERNKTRQEWKEIRDYRAIFFYRLWMSIQHERDTARMTWVSAYPHDESCQSLSAFGTIRYDLTKSIGIKNLSTLGFHADVFNINPVSRKEIWDKTIDEFLVQEKFQLRDKFSLEIQDNLICCLEIVETRRENRNSCLVLSCGHSNGRAVNAYRGPIHVLLHRIDRIYKFCH